MKFNGESHKVFYEKYGSEYSGSDRQRQVLFYLLGVSDTTRCCIQEIYDFDNHCVIPEALSAGWQTSSTSALTRLAFDLFHGDPVLTDHPEDTEAELTMYSVSNVRSRLHEWVPYAIEAINMIY